MELTYTTGLIETEKNKVKEHLKKLISPLTAIGTPEALAQVEDCLTFIRLDLDLGALLLRKETATKFISDHKSTIKTSDNISNLKIGDTNASINHESKTVFLWHQNSLDPMVLSLDELYQFAKQLDVAQFNWECDTKSD